MRIFTPYQELPTAGHPTIGTAHLLALGLKKEEITLNQKIGDVKVGVKYDSGSPGLITMDQKLPEFGPIHNDLKNAISEVLSLNPEDIDDLPVQEVSCGNNMLFVPIRDARRLKDIKFKDDIRERIGTQTHQAPFYCFSINNVENGDVQGRMFAPHWGIYEDPATGSANGPLACYLTHHQILEMPVLSLQGYEMGRPSQLHLDTRVDENGTINQVRVGGKCKLVGKGELFLGS